MRRGRVGRSSVVVTTDGGHLGLLTMLGVFLVRTQFPEHPPNLNFAANHLKKSGFGTLKKSRSPFFPHTTRIVGVFLPRNGGTFFSFPPSQRSIGMGLTREGSKIVSGVGPW